MIVIITFIIQKFQSVMKSFLFAALVFIRCKLHHYEFHNHQSCHLKGKHVCNLKGLLNCAIFRTPIEPSLVRIAGGEMPGLIWDRQSSIGCCQQVQRWFRAWSANRQQNWGQDRNYLQKRFFFSSFFWGGVATWRNY